MPPLISPKKIPPSGPLGADILIIGETPGFDEEQKGFPFAGDSGERLDLALGRAGISRNSCRITYLCNYRPANNNVDFLVDSPQLAEGIQEIWDYINKYNPKLIILLGALPLKYIGKKVNKKGQGAIDDWHGSVIPELCTSTRTVIAAFNPSKTLYSPTAFPLFVHDIRKSIRYLSKSWVAPVHDFIINPKGYELEEAIAEIISSGKTAVDIESVKGTFKILCCGFAISPTRAFCLVNDGTLIGNNQNWVNAVKRILENPNVEKIFHNGCSYDIEVLRNNGITVENFSFDTIIAAHVLEPELPRDLGFLTSIYTEEPYYKDKGASSIPDNEKGWSEKSTKELRNILYDYNCTDCIITYQVAEKQEQDLKEEKLWDFFRYEMSMVPVALHITASGLLVDSERRKILLDAVDKKLFEAQYLLNCIAGRKVNVNSKVDMPELLYNQFKLPERKKRGAGVTTDEDAIVSLIAVVKDKLNTLKTPDVIFEWEKKLAALRLILEIREYRKIKSSYVANPISDDNRARSVMKIPGTETGRWSASMYMDETGWNGQTLPRGGIEV